MAWVHGHMKTEWWWRVSLICIYTYIYIQDCYFNIWDTYILNRKFSLITHNKFCQDWLVMSNISLQIVQCWFFFLFWKPFCNVDVGTSHCDMIWLHRRHISIIASQIKATWLFVQQLIQTSLKILKLPIIGRLWGESNDDGIPLTKGQQCGKCFCCITLSCFPQICQLVVNTKCAISFLAGELYDIFGSRVKYLDMRHYFVFSYLLVYQFVFLTQWGLVMCIIYPWTGSSFMLVRLSPLQCQAITWINTDLL